MQIHHKYTNINEIVDTAVQVHGRLQMHTLDVLIARRQFKRVNVVLLGQHQVFDLKRTDDVQPMGEAQQRAHQSKYKSSAGLHINLSACACAPVGKSV